MCACARVRVLISNLIRQSIIYNIYSLCLLMNEWRRSQAICHFSCALISCGGDCWLFIQQNYSHVIIYMPNAMLTAARVSRTMAEVDANIIYLVAKSDFNRVQIQLRYFQGEFQFIRNWIWENIRKIHMHTKCKALFSNKHRLFKIWACKTIITNKSTKYRTICEMFQISANFLLNKTKAFILLTFIASIDFLLSNWTRLLLFKLPFNSQHKTNHQNRPTQLINKWSTTWNFDTQQFDFILNVQMNATRLNEALSSCSKWSAVCSMQNLYSF